MTCILHFHQQDMGLGNGQLRLAVRQKTIVNLGSDFGHSRYSLKQI